LIFFKPLAAKDVKENPSDFRKALYPIPGWWVVMVLNQAKLL